MEILGSRALDSEPSCVERLHRLLWQGTLLHIHQVTLQLTSATRIQVNSITLLLGYATMMRRLSQSTLSLRQVILPRGLLLFPLPNTTGKGSSSIALVSAKSVSDDYGLRQAVSQTTRKNLSSKTIAIKCSKSKIESINCYSKKYTEVW